MESIYTYLSSVQVMVEVREFGAIGQVGIAGNLSRGFKLFVADRANSET